ncbi:AlpA family phage regulatory protein [Marinobacter nauticus]|jgi:prophage regulatory protein|uniref:AlpA family phage regulatory protein n=1 Tax=Marinobacter nauticus TaxID=2743 RepID=UPI001C9990CE|nr:AlpA family transcriptional regulator [Marinobacter nauticus]MBY5938092.1 AlpA family transcriptional regulator [Marinobacter nauticus]MBY5955321.1 AlpA family transcriptional regulator [Marinobacter nauticus]MBY6009112.1 AlpA family transcriptional regulator [Marinobacter nauticus]
MTSTSKRKIRFIRLKAVIEKTGLSRASIYNRLKKSSKYYDAAFPKQIRIGGGAVAWIEDEIEVWMELQIEKSRCE